MWTVVAKHSKCGFAPGVYMGVAWGPCTLPPKFLAYLVILCFVKRRPKQNTFARLKPNISQKKILAWLRHWVCSCERPFCMQAFVCARLWKVSQQPRSLAQTGAVAQSTLLVVHKTSSLTSKSIHTTPHVALKRFICKMSTFCDLPNVGSWSGFSLCLKYQGCKRSYRDVYLERMHFRLIQVWSMALAVGLFSSSTFIQTVLV